VAGGVTMLRGDLRGIVKAIRLSRLNFCSAPFITRSAFRRRGLLYPVFGMQLHPMSFSSMTIPANALRLGSARL
jgi:P-type Cu+ transporter